MSIHATIGFAVLCLASLRAVWARPIYQEEAQNRSSVTSANQTQQRGDDSQRMKADDFLMMPQMMMTMGRITKGLPIEYRPVPLIVGTKREIEHLRDELRLPIDLPQDLDPNMPDSEVVSLPLTMEQINHNPSSKSSTLLASSSTTARRNPSTVTASSAHGGGVLPPPSGSDRVSLEELIPLLRTDPIPALVHDEPALVLNILRTLAGPKPDGTKVRLEPLDPSRMPQNIGNLVTLATRNPVLVRTLARFDSKFIPNLINVILGLEDEDDKPDEEPRD